jgi:hypothetical protein
MFAYIDPGAGSLVIQAIVAALVVIPFALRSSIRGLLGWLRRSDPPDRTGNDASGR